MTPMLRFSLVPKVEANDQLIGARSWRVEVVAFD